MTTISRTDRLSTISPECLKNIVRDWLFDRNASTLQVINVLENTAPVNEEIGWLLNRLTAIGVTAFDATYDGRMRWVEMAMNTDNSPRSKYYLAEALGDTAEPGNHQRAIELLQQSAEAGFPSAMSTLWRHHEYGNDGWLQKAMELDNIDGLFCVAWMRNSFEMFLQAALQGHQGGLRHVLRFRDRLSILDIVTFESRLIFLYGDRQFTDYPSNIAVPVGRFRQGRTNAESLQLLYAAGREMEGYGQLWPKGMHPHALFLPCIKLYMTVNHRARQAALQTILSMRTLKVPRDVARLIGRLVYATRENAFLWWYGRTGPRRSTRKKMKV